MFFYRGSRPVANSKPATNTKTVAFDLPPWQNQPIENGDVKPEVSFVIKKKKKHCVQINE